MVFYIHQIISPGRPRMKTRASDGVTGLCLPLPGVMYVPQKTRSSHSLVSQASFLGVSFHFLSSLSLLSPLEPNAGVSTRPPTSYLCSVILLSPTFQEGGLKGNEELLQRCIDKGKFPEVKCILGIGTRFLGVGKEREAPLVLMFGPQNPKMPFLSKCLQPPPTCTEPNQDQEHLEVSYDLSEQCWCTFKGIYNQLERFGEMEKEGSCDLTNYLLRFFPCKIGDLIS